MKKALFAILFLLTSCTYYTEKQSEAVSQNVYAANDSLAKARVDLAYFYSNETTKFIKPPKHPIQISAIYEAADVVRGSKDAGRTRVIIVPSEYKNDKVIVIGSSEYQNLLKDREAKKIIEQDNKNKAAQIEANTKELAHQQEMRDKMITDLNHLQQQVYKKDAAILWRDIIIIGLIAIIGGYIYLRASRLFFF